MDIENLDEALEAILFAAGEGVAISDIVSHLEVQRSEVKASAKRLACKYSNGCGINLIQYNNKLQFCSNPECADHVAKVLNPIREKQLTKAAMEAIAIIAYKQPITRLELEQIRGVGCDYAIQVLLKHNLIAVMGYKDAVGKPALFGTTEEFLKRFGIETIDKLPDYDRMLEDITNLTQERESALFGNDAEREAAATLDNEQAEEPPFEHDPDAVMVE